MVFEVLCRRLFRDSGLSWTGSNHVEDVQGFVELSPALLEASCVADGETNQATGNPCLLEVLFWKFT
jgi:hypothetical protein